MAAAAWHETWFRLVAQVDPNFRVYTVPPWLVLDVLDVHCTSESFMALTIQIVDMLMGQLVSGQRQRPTTTS
jgi:hypothetical protein